MITTKNKIGLLHSIDDQPSLIDDNGDKYWHINGEPNRSDLSLPYFEKSDGEKHYRLENGEKRIISNLREEWLNKDNEWHREDGPAIIHYYINGKILSEYYFLNNIEYSKKKYLEKIKALNSCNKMT
jgi:hypothetical protein